MADSALFLTRAWYVAALAREVDATGLFRRRILGTSVMLYRDANGEVVALHDRCPHRFAPLSMGKREGDEVACPYHGLRFDTQGQCVHNPHGNGRISPKAAVRRFPTVEKHGFVWIWMAEGEADHALLPDYAPLDVGHPNAIASTYMKLPVNYRLILDNVMDLSHVDHVHGEIITTRGQLSPLYPAVRETDVTVTARWEWTQTPALLILNQFLPRPADAAQHFIEVSWTAPGNIQLSVGAVQDGLPFDDGPSQYDLHSVTPEDEYSTHYFFVTRRNHIVEDADFNQFKIKAMHEAFENEDGPVMIAVQQEMGTEDFFEMDPVLMSNDLAAVKMRRRLQAMIAAEASWPVRTVAAE